MEVSRFLQWRCRTRIVVALSLLTLWWLWVEVYLAKYTSGPGWHDGLLAVAVPLVLASAVVTPVIVRRSPALSGALLLASPVVVMPVHELATAAQRYAEGEGYLVQTGMPAGIAKLGLDHQTRIPMRYSGCVTTDVWEARVWINNTTMRWLTANLGPMEGTYFGPLMDWGELEEHIAQHGSQLESIYDGSTIDFDGQAHPVPRALRYALERWSEPPSLRAAVVHDELLLVQPYGEDIDRAGRVEVFSLKTGRYLRGGVPKEVAVEHPEVAPRWQLRRMALAAEGRTEP